FRKASQTLVAAAQRLYERGLVVGFEGNLSLRVKPDRILITRSRCCKGTLEIQDIMGMDLQGKLVAGEGELSSEKELHLYFYRRDAAINAIIPAPPPHVIAASLAGINLQEIYLAETYMILGRIGIVPYSTPGTHKLSAAVDQLLQE